MCVAAFAEREVGRHFYDLPLIRLHAEDMERWSGSISDSGFLAT